MWIKTPGDENQTPKLVNLSEVKAVTLKVLGLQLRQVVLTIGDGLQVGVCFKTQEEAWEYFEKLTDKLEAQEL